MVPDDCECTAAAAPLAEPDGMAKNRYISFVPPSTCSQSAIRVTLRSLHHPQPANRPCCPGPDLSSFEVGAGCIEGLGGCVRWVGPPGMYADSANAGTTFTASMLQCEPFFHDWSDIELLHVTGREIVPSSIYDVDAIDEGCDTAMAENFSTALEITTARWGDVAGEFQDPMAPTSDQPNVVDIGTMVDRLKDLPAAPIRPLMQLQVSATLPGLGVSVIEVGHVVDAVKGLAFPYPGPTVCAP